MDCKDDSSDELKTRPGESEPAARPPDAGGGAETPAAPPHPQDKDETKHEKGGHEEAQALKGKLKKKDHEVKHLRKAQEDLKKELDALKDRYVRAAAEMDNQRKRLEREKNEYFQFALSDVLKELLPVLDNFERALKSPEDHADGKSFREGIELIRKQLLDLLAKRGVTPLSALHKKFDPAVHQAVLTEESENVEEPEVGEILQTGYLINERLLRPAMVKVVVPKKN